MAIKPTTTKRKPSSRKVRDLSARKDPKGGAQKKEGPVVLMNKQNGTRATGKRNLA
jgi:hypothetical protein